MVTVVITPLEAFHRSGCRAGEHKHARRSWKFFQSILLDTWQACLLIIMGLHAKRLAARADHCVCSLQMHSSRLLMCSMLPLTNLHAAPCVLLERLYCIRCRPCDPEAGCRRLLRMPQPLGLSLTSSPTCAFHMEAEGASAFRKPIQTAAREDGREGGRELETLT